MSLGSLLPKFTLYWHQSTYTGSTADFIISCKDRDNKYCDDVSNFSVNLNIQNVDHYFVLCSSKSNTAFPIKVYGSDEYEYNLS